LTRGQYSHLHFQKLYNFFVLGKPDECMLRVIWDICHYKCHRNVTKICIGLRTLSLESVFLIIFYMCN
jgi:hypothetical protein